MASRQDLRDYGCTTAAALILLAAFGYLAYDFFRIHHPPPPEGAEFACLLPAEDVMQALRRGLHAGITIPPFHARSVGVLTNRDRGDFGVFFASALVEGTDTLDVAERVATWEIWRHGDGGLSVSSVPRLALYISVWPRQERGPLRDSWEIEASRQCALEAATSPLP
jgi:hypothetical protein